jgi:hypothetical protein
MNAMHCLRHCLGVGTLFALLLIVAGRGAAQEERSAEAAQQSDDGEPEVIEFSDRVLYGRNPVDYSGTAADDVVARLSKRGPISVDRERVSRSGYLQQVLDVLDVPVESQLLVFSKTARVQPPVSPKSPRAIYFTDEVMIGWTPTSRELEISAIDPVKGAIFYSVKQPRDEHESPATNTGIRFERRDNCLSCHASRSTLEVPGLMLKSFVTDRVGRPLNGFSHISHDSAYERRFGGWYVTGSPTGLVHRGNLFGQESIARNRDEPGFQAVMRAPVPLANPDGYLAGTSEIVAHLVFTHQMEGINLITRVGMEARLNVRSDAEDRLIRYFVFADEPSLNVPIDRTASAFATVFESNPAADSLGRSLRQLDLKTHLLKHRLSWLVAHRSFAALPDDCRKRLVSRLRDGLQTGLPDEDFGHLPEQERLQTLAIAESTIPFWPQD